MQTVKVFWKGKFNGKSVAINAADFDPLIHRPASEGYWPEDKAKMEAEIEPESPVESTKAAKKPHAKK